LPIFRGLDFFKVQKCTDFKWLLRFYGKDGLKLDNENNASFLSGKYLYL